MEDYSMENSQNPAIAKGEINIRSQIERVIAKWPLLIVCGIIFAILGGAYSYVNQRNAIRSWQAPEVEKNVPDGIDVPDYTQARERVIRAINDKTAYLEQSVQMQLNPANVARATVDMYIMTDELKADENPSLSVEEGEVEEGVDASIQQTASPAEGEDGGNGETVQVDTMTAAMRDAGRILDHYCGYISRGLDYEAMGADYDTEGRFMRELVSIGAQDREILRSTITVSYFDEEGAEKILGKIMDAVKDHFAEAEAEFGQHELIFRNQNVHYVVDSGSLSTATAARVTEFNTLMKQYNDLKTNEKNLDTKIAEGDPKPKMSRKKMLKTAIAGFIGGVILGAALYILLLSLSGKVLSARDLNTYYGFRKLGVVPSAKKMNALTRKILASELRYESNPDQGKCYEIVNSNVKSVIGDGKVVSVVSDLGQEEIEGLLKNLSEKAEGIKYVAAGDLSEPTARKAFEESDGVVLAARSMESRYSFLNDLMREVLHTDKPVLGSIVF